MVFTWRPYRYSHSRRTVGRAATFVVAGVVVSGAAFAATYAGAPHLAGIDVAPLLLAGVDVAPVRLPSAIDVAPARLATGVDVAPSQLPSGIDTQPSRLPSGTDDL